MTVIDQYVPPERYVVVEERYIGEPRIREHISVRNDVTIINKTVNITKVTVVNNRIVNRGVSKTNVEHFNGGHHIEKVQTTRVTNETEARRFAAEGKPVRYEPPVVHATPSSTRPARPVGPRWPGRSGRTARTARRRACASRSRA